MDSMIAIWFINSPLLPFSPSGYIPVALLRFMPIDLAVLAGLTPISDMLWLWRCLNRPVDNLTIRAFIKDYKPLALHSVFDRGEFIAGWHWLLRGNIGVDIPVDSQEGIRYNPLRRPDTAPAVSG